MHPIFRSKIAIAAYLAAWLPILLQVALTVHASAHLSASDSGLVAALLTVALAIACLSPWYLCKALPLRTTAPVKLVGLFLLAALLTNAIIVGWMRLVIHFAEPWLSPALPRGLRTAAPAITSTVLLVYLLAVALHYTVLALEYSKQAELLSREAELKALKAQINPHFLFNSLNSISALALAEPKRAREMCIKLSDFLRTSLRLGDRVSVPLLEELALTKTYLEVEQVRFGSRLRVAQMSDAECERCQVPPLLVQPLVENAIKHGIATLVEGGEVSVICTWRSAGVTVRVVNPFDPDAPHAGASGLGLINVRNRLLARYGSAARMDIQVDGRKYQVTLDLPCSGEQR